MEHETPEMRRPIEAVVSPAEAQDADTDRQHPEAQSPEPVRSHGQEAQSPGRGGRSDEQCLLR